MIGVGQLVKETYWRCESSSVVIWEPWYEGGWDLLPNERFSSITISKRTDTFIMGFKRMVFWYFTLSSIRAGINRLTSGRMSFLPTGMAFMGLWWWTWSRLETSGKAILKSIGKREVFLWVFLLMRLFWKELGGKYGFRMAIMPDGISGTLYREGGSFYKSKTSWSQFKLSHLPNSKFWRKIKVSNKYFLNLIKVI